MAKFADTFSEWLQRPLDFKDFLKMKVCLGIRWWHGYRFGEGKPSHGKKSWVFFKTKPHPLDLQWFYIF